MHWLLCRLDVRGSRIWDTTGDRKVGKLPWSTNWHRTLVIESWTNHGQVVKLICLHRRLTSTAWLLLTQISLNYRSVLNEINTSKLCKGPIWLELPPANSVDLKTRMQICLHGFGKPLMQRKVVTLTSKRLEVINTVDATTKLLNSRGSNQKLFKVGPRRLQSR